MKYAIHPVNRPVRNSEDILNQLCAVFGDTNAQANQYMDMIENLENNGEKYSYESFDILSAAWGFLNWF